MKIDTQTGYKGHTHKVMTTDKGIRIDPPDAADIDAALARTHAKLEFARLERQELADVRQKRDHYKTHADKLAEAGERLKNAVSDLVNEPRTLEIEHYAKTALHDWQSEIAAYEAAQ